MHTTFKSVRTLLTYSILGLSGLGGCAAAEESPAEDDVVSATDKTDVTAFLESRAKKTFASAPSMKGYSTVVQMAYLDSDGTHAVAMGIVRRVDANGKMSPLTTSDVNGSALAPRLGRDLDARTAAYFSVALSKKASGWSVVTKGSKEAFFYPGSGADIDSFASVFGVPPAMVKKIPH